MYREIRLSSQIVKENVLPIKGAIEFLESIGFTKKKLLMEDHEEEFLVLEDSMDDLALLENSINDLKSVKRIELVLDRNVQVLLPSNAEIKMDHQKG
jgi:UBX domain-containing protein 6